MKSSPQAREVVKMVHLQVIINIS